MKPYLAVIVDSFHAALSSRILWVAFVAIWLLLGALAPIGYREDLTATFYGDDIYNGTQMKAMLARGLLDEKQEETAVGRLALAMPKDLRRDLERFGKGEDLRIWNRTFVKALNARIDDESWYDAQAWSSTVRLRELRQLDATPEDQLSESMRRRRARLRIEAALPGVFDTRASRSIILTYAGMDFPARFFEVDKTQFVSLINQFVVPAIVDWMLGFLLVFMGILVTAHIMPDLLEPGSLHLLLSKPVSRSLLFLSKFIGGCAFVFLCVVQLVVGLYLIAGFRLDVWNARVLWCIPVCVFLFAVFFSVSAVAGLRWRSPIVAIGVTCIFGLFCFVVSYLGFSLFDAFVTRPDAIQHAVTCGDTLVGTTRGNGLLRYDRDENRWVEIFESDAMSPDRVLTPILLDENRIATAQVRGGRFNPYGLGASDLMVVSASTEWSPEPTLRLPGATSRLYRAGDKVLAMNSGGLMITSRREVLEAAGEEPVEEENDENASDATDGQGDWMAKLSNMMGATTEGFASVLPPRVALSPPRGLAVSDDGQSLILLSRGRLTRLERPEGEGQQPWELAKSLQLEGEPSLPGVIALNENVLLVSRKEEPIQLIDAETLQPIASAEMSTSFFSVAAQGMGDGKRFVHLASDGKCRIVSVEGSTATLGKSLGIKEVESFYVDTRSGSLFVIHHIDQVEVLDLNSLEVKESLRPSLAGWRMVDRYLVMPLRTVTPQTGELGQTIAAMVSGQSAQTINVGAGETELVRYRILRPVLSCAGFITIMLTIGCIYFSRRDF